MKVLDEDKNLTLHFPLFKKYYYFGKDFSINTPKIKFFVQIISVAGFYKWKNTFLLR
jgi:hypothetical protein